MGLHQDLQSLVQILPLTSWAALDTHGICHTSKFPHLSFRVLDEYMISRVPAVSNIL